MLTSSEISAISEASDGLDAAEVLAVFEEVYEMLGGRPSSKWLALAVVADLAQLRATGARCDLAAELRRGVSERRRSQFMDAVDRRKSRAALYGNVMAVLRLHTELERVRRGESIAYTPE